MSIPPIPSISSGPGDPGQRRDYARGGKVRPGALDNLPSLSGPCPKCDFPNILRRDCREKSGKFLFGVDELLFDVGLGSPDALGANIELRKFCSSYRADNLLDSPSKDCGRSGAWNLPARLWTRVTRRGLVRVSHDVPTRLAADQSGEQRPRRTHIRASAVELLNGSEGAASYERRVRLWIDIAPEGDFAQIHTIPQHPGNNALAPAEFLLDSGQREAVRAELERSLDLGCVWAND